MTKAGIVRGPDSSRCYMTMLTKGERQHSRLLLKNINLLTEKSSLSASIALFGIMRLEVKILSSRSFFEEKASQQYRINTKMAS